MGGKAIRMERTGIQQRAAICGALPAEPYPKSISARTYTPPVGPQGFGEVRSNGSACVRDLLRPRPGLQAEDMRVNSHAKCDAAPPKVDKMPYLPEVVPDKNISKP